MLGPLEKTVKGKKTLLPNKSITKEEAIEMIQKRTEGYPMARSMMENLLGRGNLPTRAAIGDLVTRKYIDKFLPYYYLQGANRQYFE